jgi:hypothetical protein
MSEPHETKLTHPMTNYLLFYKISSRSSPPYSSQSKISAQLHASSNMSTSSSKPPLCWLKHHNHGANKSKCMPMKSITTHAHSEIATKSCSSKHNLSNSNSIWQLSPINTINIVRCSVIQIVINNYVNSNITPPYRGLYNHSNCQHSLRYETMSTKQ